MLGSKVGLWQGLTIFFIIIIVQLAYILLLLNEGQSNQSILLED